MIDGVPFFAVSDLCDASRFKHFVGDVVARPDFPDHARRSVREELEDGTYADAWVISPVGVFLFSDLTDAGRLQGLSAWARREAARLCPNPRPGDPAIFLTLSETGELPPRPLRYSGRRAEWEELRWSDAYLNRDRNAGGPTRQQVQARLLAEAAAARAATGDAR